MKLFGHPVHPLLIHFPTALLPMDLALSICYLTSNNDSFYKAACYCLWAGSATGVLAIITGIIDILAIQSHNKKAIALALYHGFINGLLILIFGIVGYKAWKVFPSPMFSSIAGITVKAVLVFALFIGNYLGGRLIYKYQIGIK